jgi:mannose-6-phosphate isomerase-like protein (cupin superfamily)
MTYPAIRYRGEGGETSATYRPADRPPDLTYANGTTVHYLAGGATTDGLFGLYRWEMGPARSGPDAHFHRTITESFYILSGSIRIFDGRTWLETKPGDFVHVPAGGLHGFRNESGAAASMLLHFAPGAPRESYFGGLAAFATAGRPTDDEVAAFYLEHDNHWG